MVWCNISLWWNIVTANWHVCSLWVSIYTTEIFRAHFYASQDRFSVVGGISIVFMFWFHFLCGQLLQVTLLQIIQLCLERAKHNSPNSQNMKLNKTLIWICICIYVWKCIHPGKHSAQFALLCCVPTNWGECQRRWCLPRWFWSLSII